MRKVTALALFLSLLLCGCGNAANFQTTTASTRTGGYLLEEPVTTQHPTLTGSDVLQEAQAWLVENEETLLRSLGYEQIHLGKPHHYLTLPQYTIVCNSVRYPVIADEQIIGWLSITRNPDHGLLCDLRTDDAVNWAQLTDVLRQHPDTDFLICNAGTTGMLLSPDNDIFVFSDSLQDIESFFDPETDYYTAFKDDRILISYDSAFSNPSPADTKTTATPA